MSYGSFETSAFADVGLFFLGRAGLYEAGPLTWACFERYLLLTIAYEGLVWAVSELPNSNKRLSISEYGVIHTQNPTVLVVFFNKVSHKIKVQI